MPRSHPPAALALLLVALALGACGRADDPAAPGGLAGAGAATVTPGVPLPGGGEGADPAAPTTDAGPAPTVDPGLAAFADEVGAAIVARDVDALEPVLADPFALGYEASEWQVLKPAQAAEQFRTLHLVDGATPVIEGVDDEVRTRLAGRVDVDALFGPRTAAARMLLVSGWDGDPARQGVVFLTPEGSAGYRWTALLLLH